jgi:hypothetical protein
MKEFLTLIDKYGIKPLLLVAVLWLNNRLNTVEDRLYNCYTERVYRSVTYRSLTKEQTHEHAKLVAILPDKCKRVKECLA